MRMNSWQSIITLAKAHSCTVSEQELLACHTSFRIGGPARVWVEVGSAAAMAALRSACAEAEIPCVILGNGSNLLASDNGFDGVILHPAAPEFTALTVSGQTITVGAGVKLSALTTFARDLGLSGLEFAYGIPGSVGGAVYMNAGAYGGEIQDVLTQCTVLTSDGRVESQTGAAMAFAYRHSALMTDGGAVISAQMTLKPDDSAAISARMADFLERRRSKQPLEYPSAGSVFKRPEGHFAGTLIEQCHLKGYRIGGAQVSEKHAGFIVNRGGATACDVRALIAHIQQVVFAETGVRLECEIRSLGT